MALARNRGSMARDPAHARDGLTSVAVPLGRSVYVITLASHRTHSDQRHAHEAGITDRVTALEKVQGR